MALLDLLGRRWTLRILWELQAGPLGFREAQHRCGGMSPSVLSTRLRELASARLVETDAENRWLLTPVARSLGALLAPLVGWAEIWARTLRPNAP